MTKSESYYLWVDERGRLLEIDVLLRNLLGYREEDMENLSLARVIPGFTFSPGMIRYRQSCYVRCRNGSDLRMECTLLHCDAGGGRYLIVASPFPAAETSARFGLEPVLRLILDAQLGNIVLFNKFDAAVWLNKTACTTCGGPLAHLIGKNCNQLWPNCGAPVNCSDCPAAAARKSGRVEQKKKQMFGKRWWRVTAIPILDSEGLVEHVLFIGDDITSHLEVAEEVRQNHKLESLGILAGGIAHDFNNILSGIMGYTELALANTDKTSVVRDYLEEVAQAGRRATELVRQILTFSRRGEGQLVSTDLSVIMEEVLKLLRSSFPAKVRVKKQINHNVKPVLADSVQMHQVVMNLLTNAAQAMDPQGGELIVSLQSGELPKAVLMQNPDMQPGEYLVLVVKDTGIGMTREIIESMFDPYFTTKPLGQGTGLGLSVVHGIVKECGGHIAVESEPGRGTMFTIYLPTVDPLPDTASANGKTSLLEGTETIMVVDDEPEILKIAKTILELNGYTVLTERNSQRALERFAAKPESIDLLVTDITMPHLPGDRLARECLEIRPDLPVVLMTGYTEFSAEQIRQNSKISALIMKPLSTKNFLLQIRMLLDKGT